MFQPRFTRVCPNKRQLAPIHYKPKETPLYTLGIDLSKRYFDATLRQPNGQQPHKQFDNNAKGFVRLDKWLRRQLPESAAELHACMEATNVYWEELADYLHAQGYRVSVVNPARIKGFAMSQMRRNKTDKLDSEVIAAFCAALRPRGWQPPSPTERKLRRLVRHRDGLVKTQTQQKNRLVDCRDEEVRASLKVVLTTWAEQIRQIEERLAEFIAQEPDLRADKELLGSIIGFGETTVHLLLAEMYDLANYESASAAAADAGANPSHHESGDTIRRKAKTSKQGKAAVRGALYFPALSAIQHNPVVRALAQRLKARGKPHKVIVCAAIRKLIHIAYGVLKHRSPFDPNWERPPFQPT